MQHCTNIRSKSTIKTINGYEIDTNVEFIMRNTDSNIVLEIDVLDSNKNIFETKLFNGNKDSKVRDLKAIFGYDVDIIFCDSGKRTILCDENMLILKIFDNNTRKTALNPYIVAQIKNSNKIPILDFRSILFFTKIRKLIISNISIEEISIDCLKYLKYVKIDNCKLKHITFPNKTLEYCSLKNNSLENCSIFSKILILQNNMIQIFQSTFKFKYLNLSFNPIKKIKCTAKFLNIKNTNVNHVLHGDFEVLLADFVSSFRLGKCPNLKILSINDCQITHLCNNLKNIKILKARNNYLHSIPKMNNCIHVDVSGNFLEKIYCKNTVSLSISKNQFDRFNIERFRFLRHLDISFNNMELSKEKMLSSDELKTVLANQSMIKYSPCTYFKNYKFHKCKKYKNELVQYKLESIINEQPITIFITVMFSKIKNLRHFFTDSFEKFKKSLSVIDLVSGFSNYCYKKLHEQDSSVKMTFIAITSKFLCVKSFYIPTAIFTFSEIDLVQDPCKIRIFNNVSNWCCFPLLCRFDAISRNRSCTFFSCTRTLIENFQFLNFLCPTAVNLFICNMSDFYSINRSSTPSDCMIVKKINRKTSLDNVEDKIREITSAYCNPSKFTLGFENIDFGINLYTTNINLISTHSEPTIFVFMKILFDPDIDCIILAEEYNIPSVVEFYCKVFSGKIVEKNYKLFIIGFETTLHAAFFSLKIQSILKSVGIDVCIGISSDAVFTTEYEGVVYLGGPVFNKTSRIADLGVGVFCCGCVKILSNLIEINDEGERYLKGFEKKHRIFSLSISKS